MSAADPKHLRHVPKKKHIPTKTQMNNTKSLKQLELSLNQISARVSYPASMCSSVLLARSEQA